MTGSSPTGAVLALRTIIERERRSRRPRACRAAALGLRDVIVEAVLTQRVPCLALYVSRTDEPGTEPLRRTLRSCGIPVLLPLFASDRPRWAIDGGTGRGPVTEHSIADAGLIVVPAFAVDTMGRRLGRATPSYREALRAADPRTPVLAAVFDSELFDAAVEPVPVEPSGVTVDQVVTPTRILSLDRTRGPSRPPARAVNG